MSKLRWNIEQMNKVLRKAFEKWRGKVGLAWTGGKDSTLLLHAAKQLDFLAELPVFFIDHGLHFPETYQFVNGLEDQWNISLQTITSPEDFAKYTAEQDRVRKKEAIRMLKINCIARIVQDYAISALITGIRWDEHRARADEKFFSPREDHLRIHPILHFTERDVWEYIRAFDVPYNPLYDQGHRSLGEMPYTRPVDGVKGGERAGREKDKEQIMEKLRKLGYF